MIDRKKFATVAFAVVTGVSLASQGIAGTTHEISVGPGFSFSPAEITIDTGDTIQWIWIGGLHNVVSGQPGAPDGSFHSGAPTGKTGITFEVTFDQSFLAKNPMPEHVYPYHCEVHGAGMTGAVTVLPKKSNPADLNGDNVVDVSDLLVLLGAWGECADAEDCPADFNGDQFVDVSDLLFLLGLWG